jgi:hypothetical protein
VTETHHLFGRSVPITVRLPANEHRVLDALRKRRRPQLREPGRDNHAMILQQLVELVEIVAAGSSTSTAEGWQQRLYLTVADCGRQAIAAMLEGRQWNP